MKHLKIYENENNSLKRIIKDYNRLLSDYFYAIKEKYDKLAEEDNYEPEFGDIPEEIDDYTQLALQNIDIIPNGFQFCLQAFNDEGQITGTYYIPVSDEEMENFTISIKANKYNI